jgi:hypothetical protein
MLCSDPGSGFLTLEAVLKRTEGLGVDLAVMLPQARQEAAKLGNPKRTGQPADVFGLAYAAGWACIARP